MSKINKNYVEIRQKNYSKFTEVVKNYKKWTKLSKIFQNWSLNCPGLPQTYKKVLKKNLKWSKLLKALKRFQTSIKLSRNAKNTRKLCQNTSKNVLKTHKSCQKL